jgi:hypothetical protein
MELNPCQIESHGLVFNTWAYICHTNYYTMNIDDKNLNFG